MKRIHTTALTGILVSLVACASDPAQDHYYSLVLVPGNEAPVIVADKAENNANPRMIVGPVQLARYLEQPGLPIQTSESQIQSARHHFWAEALDEAIAKVLVQDIGRHMDSVVVERDSGRWTQDGHCRVRVEFDRFHATNDSRVTASGRYWIHSTTTPAVTKKEFNIVRTLSADGYAHAVRQLRAILATLALEISERTDSESICTSTT